MASPGHTATTDPDREWTVGNPEYKAIAWYSSADGRFEERLARESPLDSFSGLNYNKIARGDNEYYGTTTAPLYANEFDEDEYYRNVQPLKSDEQVQLELGEPIEKFEAKLKEFVDKGEEVVWTPAMRDMSIGCPIAPARAIQYEISPYFQLNPDGYRKSWANTRMCEFRPILRMQQKWMNTSSDFFFRFQIMRWNLSSKIRLRYWKMVASGVYFGLMIDHFWARQYKRKFKWH